MTNRNINPRISIILPTYNRAAYIIEAIESVRNQTYSDWELLVVDDRSTDNTAELIAQVKDERIRLHKTEKRLGITGTRNEGLQNVNGELIAFIDSDDLWAADKLEKQIAVLNQYPEAGLCLTGGYNFRVLNEPVEFFYKQKEGIKYDNLLVSFFRSEVAATTPSLIFRKQCSDAIGLFDETKSFADADFILRLAEYAKGVILYEPLFYRRLHNSNISSIEWEKGCQEGVELARAYKKKLPYEIGKDALFRAYINFGEKCLSQKRNGKAIHKFLKAWEAKPFSIAPPKKIAKALLYSLRK